jgi:hypothetical protein
MPIDPEEYMEKAAGFMTMLTRNAEVAELNALSAEPATQEEIDEYQDLWTESELFRIMLAHGHHSWQQCLADANAAMEATRLQRRREAALLKHLNATRTPV